MQTDDHEPMLEPAPIEAETEPVPAIPSGAGAAEPEVRPVDELTLAEMLQWGWRAPAAAWTALTNVLWLPAAELPVAAIPAPRSSRLNALGAVHWPAFSIAPHNRRDAQTLALRVAAFLIALYGSGTLAAERTEEFGLSAGLPVLLIAFVVWLAAELYGAWPELRRRSPAAVVPADEPPIRAEAEPAPLNLFWRLGLAAGGLAFSALTLAFTVGNHFRLEGVITWGLSIGFWVAVVAPAGWGWRAIWHGGRAAISGWRDHLPGRWTLLALLLIMAMAVIFRLTDLRTIPSEMTSDHVEKILDAQNVLNGTTQVFFPNNGGREPTQFYLMALLSQVQGLGLNFFTLKLLTVIEGLLTIPILWWMGRAMIGDDEPELANAVGLLLAALVAASYWHVMLSRLGLRIILTVLYTALLVIYFSRGMRKGERADYIKTGLILGFGLYAYQAVRMLPVVIIVGVGMALVWGWSRALLRRGSAHTLRTLVNAVVLVWMAGVVFVPLMGFSMQYPEDFWRRTSGRLLGDDVVQITNDQGELVQRNATIQERLDAFEQNMPILMNNLRNALLMYNWKGDVAWITAAPNRPTMDIYTGSLLIIGLAAWLVRMVRRRDVADWLMPLMLFIMLLPSALSIAYPIENPSATRTSGTLPEAYLFAALPLALAALQVRRLIVGRWGQVASVALAGVIVLAAYGANWKTYFVDFATTYMQSSPAPYTEAGRFLRGFADSGGSFGNAFMIAYPYWWDHRAVGLEAGITDWPNGIVTREDVPRFLYDTSARNDVYRLNPDQDLLFFYKPEDADTEAALRGWFPNGYSQRISSYKPGDDYMVYRVPPLGAQGFIDFTIQSGVAAG